VFAGHGFQCSNQAILHLAVGDESETITAAVTWPSGTVQEVRLAPDQSYVLVEGEVEAFRY
jgi:hypothetical protein